MAEARWRGRIKRRLPGALALAAASDSAHLKKHISNPLGILNSTRPETALKRLAGLRRRKPGSRCPYLAGKAA